MPMAMAAEMPSHETHSMEDVMTPMAPMSDADCAHCPHHEKKKEPTQKSCAGHCLAQATTSHPSSIVSGSSELTAALPVSLPVTWNLEADSQSLPLINGPPPPIHIATVVLRL